VIREFADFYLPLFSHQQEQYILKDLELCRMPPLITKTAMRKKPSPNPKIIEPERYS